MSQDSEIENIFKNYIKVEPKVMAIETLFNNKRRFDKTNYKPPYQRNYVWDNEKASYFIESILLGTEIPPLIFFNSGESIEVIDGRQRYETIFKFVHNDFKLRKGGLLKLKDLANHNFNDLKDLKDTIWDTKLRVIEFSFHTKPDTQFDIEDIVKKEIFKRYNSGITPLKPTEIDKAKYIEDDLNGYFKRTLKEDAIILSSIRDVFHFENENIEILLKKIRQLLVLHLIPISYYAAKKDEVINKFYENLSEGIDTDDEIEQVFNSFIRKVNFLKEIKKGLIKEKVITNRLIFECLYWCFSILENENIDLDKIELTQTKTKLIKYIEKNIESFPTDRSSFAPLIFTRFTVTAKFFEDLLEISFSNYLKNHEDFKRINAEIGKQKTDTDTLSKFETLRLNKPDASSFAIDDICRQMKNQRFLIRPIYQRNEVINKIKSSAIIESILLGIKLPPIFVYKREDTVSEVVDGQQRLLSILGFLGKSYLDENKKLVKSDKNDYALNLKNGILKDFHGKKFSQLPDLIQDRILDYDLWIIEIDYKNNKYFDPIDLFIRLNYKPYPIKENTFEMWNSYVDREIIDSIKSIHEKFKGWFYLRKNNSRMENEGLLMYLIYLEYVSLNKEKSFNQISAYLDIYKVGDQINIRIKSKNDITKILDNHELRSDFLHQCNSFEASFLQKILLLISPDEKPSLISKNDKFDNLLNVERSRRTAQNFYALWLILAGVKLSNIQDKRVEIIREIKSILSLMKKLKSREEFEKAVETFWTKYN